MSLLQNEQEPVLYPWYHGYSPFLLGSKPAEPGEPLGVYVAETPSINAPAPNPIFWIGVAVFALGIVVLLLAVV